MLSEISGITRSISRRYSSNTLLSTGVAPFSFKYFFSSRFILSHRGCPLFQDERSNTSSVHGSYFLHSATTLCRTTMPSIAQTMSFHQQLPVWPWVSSFFPWSPPFRPVFRTIKNSAGSPPQRACAGPCLQSPLHIVGVGDNRIGKVQTRSITSDYFRTGRRFTSILCNGTSLLRSRFTVCTLDSAVERSKTNATSSLCSSQMGSGSV